MLETPSSPINQASVPLGSTDRRVPSRGWYGLAFALMLIGVAAFTASLNVARSEVAARIDAMQRFVAPGSTPLQFDRPGRYLIYYEKIGTLNGEDFDTTDRFPELPKMDFDVTHDATGDYLEVERADDSESQMFNHGRANSEFAFTLPPEHFTADHSSPEADGDAVGYTLTATHENDIDDRLLIAVGPPVVGQLMSNWRGPFGGAAILAFAFVVSATTVLVTWMLRHGHVNRRED